MGKAARMAVHYDQFQKLQTLMLQMGAAQFRPDSPQHIETFAHVLHLAGKEAVLANKVVKPVEQPIYQSWDEISEAAREGRRIQARFILANHLVVPLQAEKPPAPVETPAIVPDVPAEPPITP